jgi:signal transduction histidine kinase
MTEAHGITPTRARYVPWLVLALTLAVLGGAIAVTSLYLRRAMRQQIIQQDGIALHVSSFVQDSLLEGLDPEVLSDPDLRFADVAAQVFETAQRRGALAVRVFDAKGQLQMSLPLPAASRRLSGAELAAMAQKRPFSSFEGAAELSDFDAEGDRGPIIRALVPLAAENMELGSAEFILDGEKVAAALAGLDRDLWIYSVIIFLVGGGLISLSLIIAYRRIVKTNRLLAERTQSLLRANHELMLAAKTSAVGAIAAHLIHDLKSPLFGLQTFVRARANADDEDWDVAINTAERMQKLIGDIVRILQEEKTTESYELSMEEILDLVRSKLAAHAEKAGVELVTSGGTGDTLLNREANIVLLVITNLIQNALQATQQGGKIKVTARRDAMGAAFEVTDTGPGLPEYVRQALFTPCRSNKSGGTGLGLAISKQLANHLGAELCLKQSSSNGTTFELRIPERVFSSELLPR